MTPTSDLLRPVLIALADSDPAFRTKLQELVRAGQGLLLLPGTLAPPEAAKALRDSRPDVLLLATAPGADETIYFLEHLQEAKLPTKVILLVTGENQDFFVRAVRAGCRGILNRESPPELLLKCIRKVHEGELWVDRATTAQVLSQFTSQHAPPKTREREAKSSPLSPREREIVSLVVLGYKNKELAEKLVISEQTVKNHMHNIFDKLGVSDRLELALYAIHNNLLKQEIQTS